MNTLTRTKTNKPLQFPSMLSLAVDVSFDKTNLHIRLLDGREISVPLAWFPKLQKASASSRKKWRLIGHGIGIHFEDIEENFSRGALL